MTNPTTTATRDRARDAQEAAADQLDALAPYSDWSDEDADPDAMPATNGPWCGCETCEIRETLAVAWPHALAYAADLVRGAWPHADGVVDFLREEARKATLPGQQVPA